MSMLSLYGNALGFEIRDGKRLAALYRATEELARNEAPKPCFAPIYTPSGILVTEYRPADHLWHTGLYFGWVHVNQTNLWGGPWYVPETGRYEQVEHSHGVQRHEAFTRLDADAEGLAIEERLTWLDADDRPLVAEQRNYRIQSLVEQPGYCWLIETRIEPRVDRVTLGASRAARYSGLELRMGPPFADALHRCSEGREGHEDIMGQKARWVSAAGAAGGAVAMLDHPANPRHPTSWFVRRNLLGAGLLMDGDLEIDKEEVLTLRYAFVVFDESPATTELETLYGQFVNRPGG